MHDDIHETNDDARMAANGTTVKLILGQPALGGDPATSSEWIVSREDLDRNAIALEEGRLDISCDADEEKPPPIVTINTAIDCADDALYSAAMFEGRRVLIASNEQRIPFEDLAAYHIKVRTPWPEICRISEADIESYLAAEEVNPYELFVSLQQPFQKFLYYADPDTYAFYSVYAMATHLFPVFPYFPYLFIKGEKDSGKRTALRLLEPLVFNGKRIAVPTLAAVRHYVHVDSATILFNDADAIRRGGAELRNYLRAGIERGATTACMVHGKLEEFNAFGPKIFIGCEEFDHALSDCVITIPCDRKRATDHVERYRPSTDGKEFLEMLHSKACIFALQQAPTIVQSYDKLAQKIESLGLYNGTFDMWAPIFMPGMIVDSYRPQNVPSVTTALLRFYLRLEEGRQNREMSDNKTVQLLTMLKTFMEDYPQRLNRSNEYVEISTDDLFNYAKDEGVVSPQNEKPWLTRRLKDLGIEICSLRVAGARKKFYRINKASFEELCKRYLPTI